MKIDDAATVRDRTADVSQMNFLQNIGDDVLGDVPKSSALIYHDGF